MGSLSGELSSISTNNLKIVNMKSIYEQLGGAEAIVVAVAIFYNKVINDAALSPYFKGMDMETQERKMVAFMSRAFGGPDEFNGRDLRMAHAGLVGNLGLTDFHFDLVSQYMKETLDELEVSFNLTTQILGVLENTRKEVLNK
jgi:hemoglobin